MQKFSPHFFSSHLPRMVVGALLVAISLAGAVHFSAVHAAGGGARFSLQPAYSDPSVPATKSYFILDARPGTTLQSSVRVTNSGTAPGIVTLAAVDATTGQTSGTVFLATSVKQSKVGTWISLSTQQLTLAPQQSKIVSFQVVVPKDARSGQHVGGLVAEAAIQSHVNNTSGVQINIQNLSIIAVQVNLPGPVIEQLSASGIQAGGANGYQSLLVGLSNTGNDMLKPSGSLQVFDAQGQLLQTASLKLDTFLPDTSINYPVNVQKKALGPGDYKAILNLTYGHGQGIHYTTKFTITSQQVTQVFPPTGPLQAPGLLNTVPSWQTLLLILFVVVTTLYCGRKLYRRLAVAKRKGNK